MKPMNSQPPMSPSHGFPFGTVSLVFLILIVIAGGYWVYGSPMISQSMKDGEKMQMMDDKKMMPDDAMMKNDDHMMMGSGEWTKEEMKSMEKDHMMMSGSDMKDSDTMMKKDTTMKKDSYLPYDEKILVESLKSGKKVALFFHADWCPSCRNLDENITKELSSIPADTMIFKVNYDNSDALKQKYGVTSQSVTLVLNTDGTEKSRKIGARNVADIFN